MIPFTEIFEYLDSKAPEEGCGLLIIRKGLIYWQPCDNIASKPTEHFKISGLDYATANMGGDIYAVVHSHVDKSSEPSADDKTISEMLRVPYLIVSIPDHTYNMYKPSIKTNKYSGRKYISGKQDCWVLVKDYYLDFYNIELPVIDYSSEDWDVDGVPFLNSEYLNSVGFEETNTPEVGDIVTFKVMSSYINHFGIYIGDNLFLHHAENRLSCREPIRGLWAKYLEGFITCKKFI